MALLGVYEAAANFQRVADHLVEKVSDGPGGDEAFVRQAMSVAAACLNKVVKALAASIDSRTVGTGWLSFVVTGMSAFLAPSASSCLSLGHCTRAGSTWTVLKLFGTLM